MSLDLEGGGQRGDDGSVQLCKRSLPRGEHSAGLPGTFSARNYGLREGGAWSGISQEGFHCSDPFWGRSLVNEQLRGPERIPIKGIGKSGFDRNLGKCS